MEDFIIQATQQVNSVFNDLISENLQETEKIKEERYRTYRILNECYKYGKDGEKFLKDYTFDKNHICFDQRQLETTVSKLNVNVYDRDDKEIATKVDLNDLPKSATDNNLVVLLNKNEERKEFNLKFYYQGFPRFRIERYVEYFSVDYYAEQESTFTFYINKDCGGFDYMKANFIKELKNAYSTPNGFEFCHFLKIFDGFTFKTVSSFYEHDGVTYEVNNIKKEYDENENYYIIKTTSSNVKREDPIDIYFNENVENNYKEKNMKEDAVLMTAFNDLLKVKK